MSIAVKIGCDPELFLTSNKKPISAFNVIPGDKKNPHKVDKGAVQVDGMALEFNIDPAEDAKTFSNNIGRVLSQLESMIPQGTKFKISPVAYFGEEYIKDQPDAAKELGCDPDFNAWRNGERNPRPSGDAPFRTASGHIHIGWGNDFDINDPEHLEACQMMVKQLDMVLLPFSFAWDDDDTRRRLYGMPGAYRPKPYGVEYRVLSNVWIKKAYLRKFVFDMTKMCFDQLVIGNNFVDTKVYAATSTKGILSSVVSNSKKLLVFRSYVFSLISSFATDRAVQEVLRNNVRALMDINDFLIKNGYSPIRVKGVNS